LLHHPLPEALERVCKVSDELYKKGFLGGTSLARDIERGKKSEVDSLMGTLYAIGDKMGIPTPVTKAVYWVIKSVDEYAK
jgi:ketopantoate reductase